MDSYLMRRLEGIRDASMYDPKASSDDGGLVIDSTMRAHILLLEAGLL